jgi:hypothetical protein
MGEILSASSLDTTKMISQLALAATIFSSINLKSTLLFIGEIWSVAALTVVQGIQLASPNSLKHLPWERQMS